LPTLAGGIFWGFIAKIFVFRFAALAKFIAARSLGATVVFVLILYLLQYGTLAGYVLWIRARSIPDSAMAYARTARLSGAEIVADMFWPHCRSLVYALAFFIFLISSTESATIDLAIQPSLGSGTATLSHWLFEEYNIWFPASPSLAAAQVVIYGLLGATFLLACAVIFGFIFIFGIDKVTQLFASVGHSAASMSSTTKRTEFLSDLLGFVSIITVLIPFVVSYFIFPPHMTSDASQLVTAAFWTLPVAIISFTLTATLALLIRIWTAAAAFRTATWRESLLYLLILHPLSLPSLIFSTAAFWWFGAIGALGGTAVTLSWAAGHLLRAMPLLLCFTFWTYSRVTVKELEFQKLVGTDFVQLVRVSFWDRFRVDFLLIFLFAWALAWNDAVINRAAAPEVTSLYVLISPKLSVRPDYQGAQFLLLASVAIGVAIVILWRNITYRVMKG
jgi:hypothetical protein